MPKPLLDVEEFNRKRTELTDLLKEQEARWSKSGVFFCLDVGQPEIKRLRFCRTGTTKQLVCVAPDDTEKPMEECSVNLKAQIARLLPELETAFVAAYETQQRAVEQALQQISLFKSQLAAVDQSQKGE